MDRYILVHEYTKGQRIAVSVEGNVTYELLDALEGYVKRHKHMIEQDEANKALIAEIKQSEGGKS